MSNFPYFPDLIRVTGTPQELLALGSVPGFHPQDHGQVLRADGRLTVSAFTAQANTSAMVAQIQALGLEVSVTSADQLKEKMQPPSGPDPDDGGGTS